MNRSTQTLLGILLLGGALAVSMSAREPRESDRTEAHPPVPAPTDTSDVAPPHLPCPSGAYLCPAPGDERAFMVRRWIRDVGTLIVHVPRPGFEDAGIATRLQAAAAAGIRAWNGHPFRCASNVAPTSRRISR